MKTVSFHHKETGIFSSAVLTSTDDSAIAINTPRDHVAIEGAYDPLSKRVDVATGEVVDYQPPLPSADHEWNATTKRWQLTAAVTAKREARRSALASIAALEASGVRAVRELALGQAGALDRLKALDIEIAAQRLKL